MSDWNPELYLKFKNERTQPVCDLISRIEKNSPLNIIDIGCGPGNSTKELKKRWPAAKIIGLDSSPNMIEKAKNDMPDIDWIIYDADSDLSFLGKFDIVFSNAAIQWIPNHENLLNKLFSMLNENGVLAVQVPNVENMGINIAIHDTINEQKWSKHLADNICESFNQFYNPPEFYYDILSKLTKKLNLWETYYYHIMSSHRSIIDWYKSTGMKPILDGLSSEKLKTDFENDVLNKIKKDYTIQKDGNVLFKFRRIFFTAYKQ